jgi:D-alanine-D-alanine ligase
MADVLVLYNAPTLPASHPDAEAERDVLGTVEHVARTLTQGCHRVTKLGIARDPSPLVEALKTDRPDVVFNLFEGTAERNQTEAYAIGLLEWFAVPYTGCPLTAAVLCRDKPLTKKLLLGAGLPTAGFFTVERLPLPQLPKRWPVMVKLAAEDASVGIDNHSVATNEKELNERIRWLLENYRPPVLVEEFLEGREFNVGVVEAPETRALPVSEIIFDCSDPGRWPIVTYESKWKPGSIADLAALPKCPADIAPALADQLSKLALAAFRLLNCQDYARIDFRTDRDGTPFILEVNPNPDFSPTAGMARALKAAGMTHEAFTLQLVRNALIRQPRPSPTSRELIP